MIANGELFLLFHFLDPIIFLINTKFRVDIDMQSLPSAENVTFEGEIEIESQLIYNILVHI